MNLSTRSFCLAVLSSLSLLVMSHCCGGPGVAASQNTAALGKLMVERLSWMDEVAAVKKARSLPVTDPVREAQLLAAMTQRGTEAGLPETSVKAFFEGQMKAARTFQEEWLKLHADVKPDGKPLTDLVKTVRPELDRISEKMISNLAIARSQESTKVVEDARQQLSKAGYSKSVIASSIRGLEAGLK